MWDIRGDVVAVDWYFWRGLVDSICIGPRGTIHHVRKKNTTNWIGGTAPTLSSSLARNSTKAA